MSSEELLKKIQNALTLEARLRFKFLKQIGFEALEEYKALKNPHIDDLKNYKEIFTAVKQVPAISNKFQIALTKIINQYLHLLGCDNPKILFKKSSTIAIDTACIAIGDPFYGSDDAYDPKVFVAFINSGKAYYFGTGGDAIFNVQIRIIEAPEPVLTTKEYKNVVGASPRVVLNFPTGKLAVSDGAISKEYKNQLETDIAPGNYKCQVFIFKFPDDYSFYIVLSKCEETALNNENELFTLEPDF